MTHGVSFRKQNLKKIEHARQRQIPIRHKLKRFFLFCFFFNRDSARSKSHVQSSVQNPSSQQKLVQVSFQRCIASISEHSVDVPAVINVKGALSVRRMLSQNKEVLTYL